jgi:signal transduction histidine kinase
MKCDLSTFSAGIAHQVKNPLFAITATLDALERRFSGLEDQKQYFAVIRDSVHRLDELTQQLMAYSDPTPLCTRLCDIALVMQKAAQTCSPVAAKLQVDIRQEHSGNLPLVMIDPYRMQEAFSYLLEHAVLRCATGGVVTLRSSYRTSDDRQSVECVLEDSGTPVPDVDLEHVLEPFFKRLHVDSGLGLAIADLIVRQHGSKIFVQNRNGAAGMRFVIPMACSEPR